MCALIVQAKNYNIDTNQTSDGLRTYKYTVFFLKLILFYFYFYQMVQIIHVFVNLQDGNFMRVIKKCKIGNKLVNYICFKSNKHIHPL
jgi:hypothetical protein